MVGAAEGGWWRGGNRGNPCLPHSHRCAADAHVASARGPSVRRNDEANGCCSGAGRGFRREPAVGRLDGRTASARCDKVQFDRAAACSQVKRPGGHVVAARRGLLSDLDGWSATVTLPRRSVPSGFARIETEGWPVLVLRWCSGQSRKIRIVLTMRILARWLR